MRYGRRISHNRRVDRARRERGRFLSFALGVAAVGLLTSATPAFADDPVLQPATYPDMTTYQCHTDPIPIYAGQNTNLFGQTKTCPNAQKVSGPGDASIFSHGSNANGYVTRFKPSMVEVHDGRLDDHAARLGPAPAPRRLALPERWPDVRLG